MNQRSVHATRQLRSWLLATEIPFEFNDGKLSVQTPSGDKIAVEVQEEGDKLIIEGGTFKVPALSIVKPQGEPFNAFHALTGLAGYGSPVPVDRGPEPGPNLRNQADGLDTLFRHREFRKAPNPSPEKFNQYKKVLDIATNRFLRMNGYLCDTMKWDISDVRQLALVWTTNFCGHWESPDPQPEENERNLMTYLKQRFYELHLSLLEKKKSSVPEMGVAAAVLLDNQLPERIFEAHPQEGSRINANDEGDVNSSADATLICPECHSSNITLEQSEFYCLSCGEKFVHAILGKSECRVDRVEISSTRASKKLLSLLSELPHDEMILRLIEASQNKELADDAQKLAQRRLNIHTKSCQICSREAMSKEPIFSNKSVDNKSVVQQDSCVRVLRWSKVLSTSDAQRKKRGKQRSGINLTTGMTNFFRDDFLKGASWERNLNKKGNLVEIAIIPFRVIVLGENLGILNLKISYSISRIKNVALQGDRSRGNRCPTVLHTGELLPWFLKKDMTGKTLLLGKEFEYSLKII